MIKAYHKRHMQWRWLIAEMARRLRPDCYVELGIKKCHTFNMVAPLVKRAVAVDRKERFMGYAIDLPHVEKYAMTTQDFLSQWHDPIDMIFIDADHSEEAVQADFDGCLPYVLEGTGLILLHDTHPCTKSSLDQHGSGDAWKVAERIHKDEKYRDIEIVTIPGPDGGLSIARKAPRHLYEVQEI